MQVATTSALTLSVVAITAAITACFVVFKTFDTKRKSKQNIQEDQCCTKDVEYIARLEAKVEKLKLLRAQERQGRTNVERQIREMMQKKQQDEGYVFQAIGYVKSCFADRRGTPRQGILVPSARAHIKLVASIPPSSLEYLDQFSHLWVIFVFHENTNVVKAADSKNRSTFPAKIAPPRLGGKKVGLFSTRTPHRPNSIGLTVVKIDKVHGNTVEISGHDLVEGTPVLDVKPYVYSDFIPEHICPPWVAEKTDILERQVIFTEEATVQLEYLISKKQLSFYHSLQDIQDAIMQMLVLDIRSVHQGRGKASDTLFTCRFDKLAIEFRTLEDHIEVVQCYKDTTSKSS